MTQSLAYQGLLQAIIESPDDDSLRLIMADLLDDRGEGERAEFVRVQVELAHCSLDEDSAKRMASFSHNPNSVRHALEVAKKRRRERELLGQHGKSWAERTFGDIFGRDGAICIDRFVRYGDQFAQDYTQMSWWWDRGFISSITCAYDDWARHADRITARCPIERVTLTTWPQSCGTLLNSFYELIGVNNSAEVTDEEALARSMDWQDLAAELVKRTWPHITFTLPSEVAV